MQLKFNPQEHLHLKILKKLQQLNVGFLIIIHIFQLNSLAYFYVFCTYTAHDKPLEIPYVKSIRNYNNRRVRVIPPCIDLKHIFQITQT